MKVGNVTERSDSAQGPSILDSDELDRTGIDLGATGRLQLMFKLAEGELGKGMKYVDSTLD
jgi:RNA-binding protein 39